MNETLRTFVRETDAEFSSRMKSPRALAERPVTDEYIDTAIIGGYSVEDILAGRVSEHDIDPQVLKAFHLQYPNEESLVDLMRSNSGHRQVEGIVNAVKGKLFEVEYVDHLNDGNLPHGFTGGPCS